MDRKISAAVSCAFLGTALAFGTMAVAEVPGQTPKKPAQSRDSMAAFWEKFKAAAIKSDKETVAALSRFPISLNDGMTPIRNRTQLIKHYRFLFFGETNAAKCFPKAKPEIYKDWRPEPRGAKRPKEFIVGCPFASDGGDEEPFEYRFTLTPNGWRFTSFTNINE